MILLPVRYKSGPVLEPSRDARILSPMRILLLTLSTALAFPATAADPPTKRKGGFFGFGAPPAEQISAGLFPDADGQAPSGNLSSSSTRQPAPTAAEEGIFRSGEPARVAPVS